jgi:site-specific recombinase XerD
MGLHGDRTRGLIVVLWRAGLRIQEALDLSELDLDARRGSVLVRCGKGGRRREVGTGIVWRAVSQGCSWSKAQSSMTAAPAVPQNRIFRRSSNNPRSSTSQMRAHDHG